jgi:hypothetical protein
MIKISSYIPLLLQVLWPIIGNGVDVDKTNIIIIRILIFLALNILAK